MPGQRRVALTDFAGFEVGIADLLAEVQGADPARRAEARRILIAGKSRARMGAARCRDAGRRAELLEMAEWILVLLENPPAFPEWSALRKRSPDFANVTAERSGLSVRQTTDAAGEP